MIIKKNHLLIGSIASALVLGACSSASAETDMSWEDDRTEGTTAVMSAEAEGNVKKSAQEAVDAAKKILTARCRKWSSKRMTASTTTK